MRPNFYAVAFLNGIVLCCLSGALCIPLIYDIIFCNSENIKLFIIAIMICMFCGISTIFAYKSDINSLSVQDMYLATTCFWIISSFFSAIPFYLYNINNLDFPSALFEATSGITTTGATIYKDVEILPRSLVLWRFILHLIGGAGIVAIALLISPMLRIGGIRLLQTENSDRNKEFALKATQTAAFFVFTYLGIIIAITVCLAVCGINWFDAFCHSISAISTGGFSTKNLGIEFFNNQTAKIILIGAMFIGGLAFADIMYSIKTGFNHFFKEKQTKIYCSIILIVSSIAIIHQFITTSIDTNGVIDAVFDIVSSATTTGLNTTNSYYFSSFLLIITIILLIIGGCSGSTTGGIKLFRVNVIYSTIKNYILSIIKPFSIQKIKYTNSETQPIFISVFVFLSLLIFIFLISILIISISSDYSINIILAAVFSCLFNAGFDISFFTHNTICFADLNIVSKTVLIIDMLLGRLELLPIFIAIASSYKRKQTM